MKTCKNCQKPRVIVNKKHSLCDDCNYQRIHGKTKQEKYAQNSLSKPRKEKNSPTTPQTKRTPLIAKKTTNSAQLKNLKDSISLEAQKNDNYKCSGCGKTNEHLDRSHILSVGQRKDLELEKDNIDLLCRNCHMDWESGDIEKQLKLNCFQNYMIYIADKDPTKYQKLMIKLGENGYIELHAQIIEMVQEVVLEKLFIHIEQVWGNTSRRMIENMEKLGFFDDNNPFLQERPLESFIKPEFIEDNFIVHNPVLYGQSISGNITEIKLPSEKIPTKDNLYTEGRTGIIDYYKGNRFVRVSENDDL